jgi:Protein of unknown function (DUF1592)/Protein of unknown function (DUF1588)/Protein of unknown function (DUF1595)/Protein of unknown function (DUF1587)/Protein of unknown function (DUF1585)
MKRATVWVLGITLVAAALAACDDGANDQLLSEVAPGIGDPKGPMDSAGALVGSTRFVRLTHIQWENAITDLFAFEKPFGASAQFSTDATAEFDTDGRVLQISPNLWNGYRNAAEVLGDVSMRTDAVRNRWFPKGLPVEDAAAGRAFVERMGLRIFRRPLTPAEITKYADLYRRGIPMTGWTIPLYAGARIVLQTMLQSPHFLYRTELGAVNAPLSGYERASRLSFSLWNSIPDDELLRAAGVGELDTNAGVEKHFRRMAALPRARETVARFHDQLYGLSRIATISKDASLNPNLSATLGKSMSEELKRFMDATVFDSPKGLAALLTSRDAFVNADTAPLYGQSGSFSGFTKVSLDPLQRSGLLTRVGFAAYYADDRLPSPIHRGVFISRKILCSSLPDPPPNIPPLPALSGTLTNRQRIEAHTGKNTCGAGCHGTFINPAGFALEHYDHLGRWRTTERELPVNAADSITLSDGRELPFTDAVDLSDKLAKEPQVHACYTKSWASYLLGRGVTVPDANILAQLTADSTAGASVVDLMLELTLSSSFLTHVEPTQ